jgi:hypothetical protein
VRENQGRREGGRGGGLVYCLSSAISRGTGARVHKSSFCPEARGWLSPALTINIKHAGDAMIFVLISVFLTIENKVKALKNIY